MLPIRNQVLSHRHGRASVRLLTAELAQITPIWASRQVGARRRYHHVTAKLQSGGRPKVDGTAPANQSRAASRGLAVTQGTRLERGPDPPGSRGR